MSNETFRLNARNVYLTYPQCPMEMQDMLQELNEIKPYLHYCICRERHEDGNYHLHVLLQYETPCNVRRANYYDVRGYHPNVQSARDVKSILKYSRKDGNYEENWPEKRAYGEIIGKATNYQEFMDLMRENQPKDYVVMHERLEYFADKHYPRPKSPYQELPNMKAWKLPNDLQNWVSGEFKKTGI